MKNYLSILFICFSLLSCAQREAYKEDLHQQRYVIEAFTPSLPEVNDSVITVIDTLAGKPISKYIKEQIDSLAEVYRDIKDIPGYRVQIYSGSKMSEAENIRRMALSLYKIELNRDEHPPIIIKYDSPYFRVKIGNFLHKLDAQPTLHLFEEHENFEDALLVPDRVDIHNLD